MLRKVEGVAAGDCYDVIADVDAAMRESMLPGQEYLMLGGIASGAYVNSGTVIDRQSELVIPDKYSSLSTIRPNGSKRDIDLLIDTVIDDETADKIKTNVRNAVDDKLMVSVFGFDWHVPEPSSRQIWAHRFGTWLSRRTMDSKGVLRFEMYPLEREVDPETYEPWKFQLPGGNTVNVLHPAGHVLAYATRSSSGVRHKDYDKVKSMFGSVLSDFMGEVHDGPFNSWYQFAADIRRLRQGWRTRDEMPWGLPVFDFRLLQAKGEILAQVESLKLVEYIAQQEFAQKALNGIIGSK